MTKTRKKTIRVQITLLLVILFIASACNRGTKNEQAEHSEMTTERKEVINEDFETFFKRFGADSVFQLSRVRFPISYYSVDIEDKRDEHVYTEDDFWYIDFTIDSNANSRTEDAYEPIIKREGDAKAMYIRQGIDNGIRIEYYFEIDKKGKWYMIEIIDESN